MASEFRAAVESGDVEAIFDRLAPDVTFRSPVVYKPYEGREAVAVLLRAVMQVFEDFRYVAETAGDRREILVFEARVGDREVQGVDILHLDDDGRVDEFAVMVRPLSGVNALAEAMQKQLAAASG